MTQELDPNLREVSAKSSKHQQQRFGAIWCTIGCAMIQEYSRVKYQNIVVAKTLHFWSLLHRLNLRIRCWTKMLSDSLRLDPWAMQRHAKINYVQGVQHRDHVAVQSCPGMARRGPSHRVGPEREAGRSIWVRNWGLSQAGWPLYDHGQVPRGTWI